MVGELSSLIDVFLNGRSSPENPSPQKHRTSYISRLLGNFADLFLAAYFDDCADSGAHI